MAIEKDIAIHTDYGVIDYVTNEEKCDIANFFNVTPDVIDEMDQTELAQLKGSMGGMENILDYAENLEKTVMELDGDKDLLITGVGCCADTAALEFQMDRQRYYRAWGTDIPKITGTYVDKRTGEIRDKQSIECYHVIQSFPEIEGLDPRLVHRIGIEYAEKAFPGHKCVVTTHMNTKHLHNHIVVCNYNAEEPRKYKMNTAKRREIRKLNDEISLKYGLPILIGSDMDHSSSLSYLEWEAQRNGDSWKDKIRSDIQVNIELSKSWEEYVRRMEESGYTVNQRGKYVTYSYLVGEINGKEYGERKVRDKTLGEEFTRDYIMERFGETPELPEPKVEHMKEQIKTEKEHVSFFVSRYAPDGRRRSDIELILLMAIKIIKYFLDKFFDREKHDLTPDNPVYQPARIKLQAMQQALNVAQHMNIKTKDELTERMNTIGARLSHAKRELSSIEKNLAFADQMAKAINEVKELEPQVTALGFTTDQLHLHELDEETIWKNNAKEFPMTPNDRQKLYVMLEDNPQWKLKYKFEAISYQQANAVFDFIEKRTTTRPDCLLTDEEFQLSRAGKKYDAIRAKQDKNMKEKYGGIDAPKDLKERAQSLLEANGVEVDTSDLNMYDALKIIYYYENQENSFDQPFINSGERDELNALLKEKSMTLNRKIEFVMKSELPTLLSFLRDGKGQMPDLLKPSQGISASSKEQIAELLAMKGEKCSIPLEELSQADGFKLFSYLLNKGVIPEIMDNTPKTDPNIRRDYAFANELEGLSQDNIELLQVYRALMNDLVAHGVDANSLDSVLRDANGYRRIKDMQQAEIDILSTEYKNLARLNFSLSLAESPQFTRGPLFTKEEIELQTKIQENAEEVKPETREEERKIEEEMEPIKETDRKKYWKGLDDGFFDRM